MEDKKYRRDTEKAAIVSITARITGLKKNTVGKVIKDDRKNDLIMFVYMELQETIIEKENELIAAVKKLIPFN